MTGDSSPLHLGPDELDAWLAGIRAPELARHVDACPSLSRAGARRRGAQRAARGAADPFALRRFCRPGDGLGSHPGSVRHPRAPGGTAAAVRLEEIGRDRGVGGDRASGVDGGAAWSGRWQTGTPSSQPAAGSLGEAGRWAWVGLRGAALNLIEQPWFSGFRSLVDAPGRLALASAAMSLMYVSGILALRHLLAVPTQRVPHANQLAASWSRSACSPAWAPAGTRRALRAAPHARRHRDRPRVRRPADHADSPQTQTHDSGTGSRRRTHDGVAGPEPPGGHRARRARRAAESRARKPDHGAGRSGAPGRLHHRVLRDADGSRARAAGGRERLRTAARQSRHRGR